VEKALIPLLSSPNPKTRNQAVIVAFTLRENSLDELPLLVMKRLLTTTRRGAPWPKSSIHHCR